MKTTKQIITNCNYDFSKHFQRHGWTVGIKGGVTVIIEPKTWEKILNLIPFPETYSSHFVDDKKEQRIFIKWVNHDLYEEVLLRTANKGAGKTFMLINNEVPK